VEFKENITHERDVEKTEGDTYNYKAGAVNNRLYVFKNTHFEGDVPDTTANEKFDGFYYFAHYLNQSVEIPFRRFSYNSKEFSYITTKGLRFYRLSDSSDFSADEKKKDVNKIITDEKAL